MSIKYRLKNGAPPDSELSIVAKLVKRYQPKLEAYREYEDGPHPAYTQLADNLIECLNFDALSIQEGYYYIPEFFDGEETAEVEWEVIDKDGTVWSEAYEDNVDDNTEGE